MGALAVSETARLRATRASDAPGQPRLFAIPGGGEAGAALRPPEGRFGLRPADAQRLVTRPVPLRPQPVLTPGPGAGTGVETGRGAENVRPITAARSLDSMLLAAWAGLAAGHPIACPVCDGRMDPRPAASEGVAGGRCRDCGTTID